MVSVALGQLHYTVEKSSSKINWWGYKLLKTKSTSHHGTMKFNKGQFLLDDKNQLKAASFTANINTLECEDLKGDAKQKNDLEKHLKSADFFDTKKFPIATFVLKRIVASGNQHLPLKLTGNLMIKGITKLISFKAKNELKEGLLYFESEKFTINRKDFKVEYEATYKDVVIKNDIDLKIKIVAKK